LEIDRHYNAAHYRLALALFHAGQLTEALGDIYGEYNEWGYAAGLTLDAMIARKLFSQDDNVMEKYIAGLESDYQGPARRYWARFVETPAWEITMEGIVFAGRAREMGPAMFQAAVDNSLRDPSGYKLMDWIWSRVRKPGALDDPSTAELAILFQYGIKRPEDETSDRRAMWLDIWGRLAAGGYVPVDMPDEALDDVTRRLGLKPELQGGQLFRESMRQRMRK